MMRGGWTFEDAAHVALQEAIVCIERGRCDLALVAAAQAVAYLASTKDAETRDDQELKRRIG
jgi:hypothetical protein